METHLREEQEPCHDNACAAETKVFKLWCLKARINSGVMSPTDSRHHGVNCHNSERDAQMKLTHQERYYTVGPDDGLGSIRDVILRVFQPSHEFGGWLRNDRTIRHWLANDHDPGPYRECTEKEITILEGHLQEVEIMTFSTHPTLGRVVEDSATTRRQ